MKPLSVMRLKHMDKVMHPVHQDRETGLDIVGEQITYNGTDFGYIISMLSISHYEDHRNLNQLKVTRFSILRSGQGLDVK